MTPQIQARTLANAPEPESTLVEYPVLAEDIALDLFATARNAAAGRVFWEGDRLVHLGFRNIDCESLLGQLPVETKESFKTHILSFVDSKRYGRSAIMYLVSSFCAASVGNSLKAFDIKWISAALRNASFRDRTFQARIFLDYWKDRYADAATDDALNLLVQITPLPVTSNNVESDDPEKSWMTDDEYDDLLRTTWENYELSGATQPALIRLLALQYARRPSQLSGLKFGDLKSGAAKTIIGVNENEIHFPAVKEPGVEIEFRGGAFEAHPIAKHLWDMLQIQKAEVKAAFERVLGVKLSSTILDHLPIFTSETRISRAARMIESKLNSDPTKLLDDELYHLPPARVGRVIQFKYNTTIIQLTHWYSQLPVRPISLRTGEPLVVNAVRLRHTRARQLARMGVPRPILSYWLGHNDGGAIDSYYNDPAEEARKLDERMAPGLAPIAQAFHGRLIVTDSESTYPGDPLKRLEFANNGLLKNVGKCGFYTFCGTSSIPLPCYRCRSFEPLVDAPHQEVLEALRLRQAQENEIVKLGSQKKLLKPIDLSADIRAVERCIHLCNIKREQK